VVQMGRWKICTISDLGTVVGGATPSTRKRENYEGGTIPWITPKDLSGVSRRFISHGERNITQQGLESCSAQLLPPETVLFSSRAPIGYVAIAEKELCTNQGFKSIIPNKDTDFMFLYYLLKFNKDKIEGYGSGTTFKEVSGASMRKIEVSVPELKEEQRRIARVLSIIDTKIENNTLINDNLEKQAKLVYDYWFNQFEFPDENGKPYKSSGRSMVWNGELSREIPEGWKVKTLRHVILNAKNGDWGNENYKKDSDIKVKCFRGADFSAISQEHQISAPTRYIGATHADRLLSNGDLVIEVSGGSPSQSTGRVGYINDVFIERCEGSVCCSNFCKAFTPLTLDHQFWLYFTWKSLYDSGLMFNYEGKTTGIKNLLFETLINSVKIAVPNTHLLKKFNGICSCMYAKIQKSLIESENLSSIRDSLLPLLMNGQAIVRD